MDNGKRKGAYRRKDSQRGSKADERERSHKAGNPLPEVRVYGLGVACDEFFKSRGFKPSISEHLQTQGVVIGIKRWVRRGK